MREMGVEYVSRWQREPEGYAIDPSGPNPVTVTGFDYVYRLDLYDADSTRWSTMLDSVTELSLDGATLQLARAGDPASDLSVDLTSMLIALRAKEERGESYGREETTVESEGERYQMAFYLRHAGGGGDGDSITVERLSATILVKVK
jgi:hypothetical protein